MMRVSILALVGVTACGGGGHPTQQDATSAGDGANDGSPSTNVSVTVYSWVGDGNRDTTAIAIFSDPSGSVIQAGMVDANGQASAAVPAGGTVTVLQAANDPNNFMYRNDDLTTIRGVKPGDALVVGKLKDPAYRAGLETSMTMNYTNLTTSSGPYVFAACPDVGLLGGAGQPFGLTFHASCVTPTFDQLTLTPDAMNHYFYVWQPGLPYSANGTYTVPDTWQPIGHNTTTLLNVPATVRGAEIAGISVNLKPIIGGVPMSDDMEAIQFPPAGTSTLSLQYAPPVSPTQIISMLNYGIGSQEQLLVTTGSVANVSFDFAALPLPTPTHIVANPSSVTWQDDGTGTPDARFVAWYEKWVDGNGVQHQARWTVLEEAQPSSSTNLPPLPPAYADDDPTQHTGPTQSASVGYVDYDNLAGYDAARPYGPMLLLVETQFLSTDHRVAVTGGGSMP